MEQDTVGSDATIEDGVRLDARVIVLPGVRIGAGSVATR